MAAWWATSARHWEVWSIGSAPGLLLMVAPAYPAPARRSGDRQAGPAGGRQRVQLAERDVEPGPVQCQRSCRLAVRDPRECPEVPDRAFDGEVLQRPRAVPPGPGEPADRSRPAGRSAPPPTSRRSRSSTASGTRRWQPDPAAPAVAHDDDRPDLERDHGELEGSARRVGARIGGIHGHETGHVADDEQLARARRRTRSPVRTASPSRRSPCSPGAGLRRPAVASAPALRRTAPPGTAGSRTQAPEAERTQSMDMPRIVRDTRHATRDTRQFAPDRVIQSKDDCSSRARTSSLSIGPIGWPGTRSGWPGTRPGSPGTASGPGPRG